jgi:hypothetical protein
VSLKKNVRLKKKAGPIRYYSIEVWDAPAIWNNFGLRRYYAHNVLMFLQKGFSNLETLETNFGPDLSITGQSMGGNGRYDAK